VTDNLQNLCCEIISSLPRLISGLNQCAPSDIKLGFKEMYEAFETDSKYKAKWYRYKINLLCRYLHFGNVPKDYYT
jgi:hypothetical protein